MVDWYRCTNVDDDFSRCLNHLVENELGVNISLRA